MIAPGTALVVGEALIDIVALAVGGAAAEHVGGSPANVAMGLARLGHDTTLATYLGADARGHRVRDVLAREGVRFSPGSFAAAHTSTALARIDTAGAASYEFDIEWRFNGRETGCSPALVHTGSIALFLEPGGAAVVDYLAGLAPEVVVTIDPNVRPALMPSHEVAIARFEQVARRAQLIKMSDEDAEWLYPELSPEAAATQVLGLTGSTCQVVVVTLGAAGALAVTAAHSVTVPAAPATVVDTISAGDSFMAALASSLLGHGVAGVLTTLDTVLARAARAAAIAVSAAGANPPRRELLDG